MAEGPAIAITQMLTLGTPVVGRCNALELLLPCCVPAVWWQKQKGKKRGGRLSDCSGLSQKAGGAVGRRARRPVPTTSHWSLPRNSS